MSSVFFFSKNKAHVVEYTLLDTLNKGTIGLTYFKYVKTSVAYLAKISVKIIWLLWQPL